MVARAEGPYIYDKQGKRYLEGLTGLWCTALGYGNEEVIEAAERQMRGGFQPCSAVRPTLCVELADKLAAMVQCRMVESSWATQDLMPTTHS